MHPPLSLLLAPAFTALLILSGCSTPETYYSLSADGPAPTNTTAFALGVGPISLPDYIDRAELVFQSETNRFEIPFERRWAGSLEETTTRVLGTNLARRLKTGNLHLYPWEPGTDLRYQVRVQIRQFHAVSAGDAILDAQWRIENGSSHSLLVSGVSHLTEPVIGDGYDAVVAAESRLLAQLADTIAARFPKGR